MNSREVIIPEAAVWLLRIAVNETIGQRLRADPVIFSAWYAQMFDAVEWPSEVRAIQDEQRRRRFSLERLTKLLANVNYSLTGVNSARHARLVLEGYEVHSWVVEHAREFNVLASEALRELRVLLDIGANQALAFAARVADLAAALELSPLEKDILSFAVLMAIADEVSALMARLNSDKLISNVLWRTMFDTSAADLARAMRADSPLRLSGILQTTGWCVQLAAVSSTWIDILASEESLYDSLLEQLPARMGSGRPAKLAAEDLDFTVRLLKSKDEAGINVLFYGPPTLDKRGLLDSVLRACGRRAYRLRPFSEAPQDVLPSIVYAAFRFLATSDASAVLILEQPDGVLEITPRFIRALFGVEVQPESAVPFDQYLLSTNRVPGIWLSSDVAGLKVDTLARFVFHAPLKKADRGTQERLLRESLQKQSLSEAVITAILSLDGVSTAQVDAAMTAVRAAKYEDPGELESAVVQVIRRSQRALARKLSSGAGESVTQYSLQNLNTAGRFSPEQILGSFARRQKGSLLLYGPPGTGKSLFVEYVARQLDRPLISKSASELLSKWIGDTEKNLASAFEEAAMEDAILFFDEGDSLLRSRVLADHSWEVSQTNELLKGMEVFDGIVILATNMFRDLDSAALRRFTFKIEFRELDAAQRWRMFITESGIAKQIDSIDVATKENWEERLVLMQHLTAGDFATVKRQALVLDIVLSPEEWLEQLQIECDIKSSGKLRGSFSHRLK